MKPHAKAKSAGDLAEDVGAGFRILIHEPDERAWKTLSDFLTRHHCEVVREPDFEALIDATLRLKPDVLLSELKIGRDFALGFPSQLRQAGAMTPVIFMTGSGTTDTAIESTKAGAFDYLVKPLEMGEVWDAVERAGRGNRLMEQLPTVDGAGGTETMVGTSRAMQEIYKELGRIAAKPVTVLIRGEIGTGKELIALAIYRHGHRAHLPFIAVNCAAIPETLLESELFGHEKGAFTGADTRKIGRFEQANNGTIFLDEIGEISPATQAKLLRVLQERSIQRLGGREDIPVDVRVITATNRDLERMIEDREFRADLFYRLNVVALSLPPLRRRREDIPLLVRHFLARFSRELSTATGIEEAAIEFLRDQPWPGNVRQLENTVRLAILTARGLSISTELVREILEETSREVENEGALDKIIATRLGEAADGKASAVYTSLLREFEREVLSRTIRLAHGNQSRAARWLGISRLTLREKLVQFGLHPRES